MHSFTSSTATRASPFIDPERRLLVWFNLDDARNFSCFYLEESVDTFLEQKGDFYWRLPDTELE
jgi:hypothetical protein